MLYCSDKLPLQAQERAHRSDMQMQQEREENEREIEFQSTSDMLTENPSASASHYEPHRVLTDRWRGMTADQIQEIRREQREQINEAKVWNL